VRGLTGKVAIVAGGGSGIGAATAVRLGEEGASVVVGDLAGDAAVAVAQRITDAGGRATAVTFDIADPAAVQALIAAAVDTYGGVDALMANAANLRRDVVGRDSDAVTLPLEVFDATIHVNLRGHLLCTQYVVPELLKRGGGAIVYTSSAAGHVGESERPSYAMSKAGINALMRHVASRWGRDGVRANAVAPGFVITPSIRPETIEAMKDSPAARARSLRLGKPEDIAAMTAFLMSDDGEWINGQVLSVDGGSTLRP
jgi:NAD(P)-dependent dehydrogenase (short-subunit alcohol dehydrogenase family)